jgi:hypothetical protein
LGRDFGELTMDPMASETQRKEIDEERAAALLGFTPAQLRRLCNKSGLAGEGSERKRFTYAELYRLCCSALRSEV